MRPRNFSLCSWLPVAGAAFLFVPLLITTSLFAANEAKPAPARLLILSVPALSGNTLNVDLIRGTLEVVTGDRDEATLEIFPATEQDAAASAKNVRLTRDGHQVKLRQSGGEPGTWRYRMTVPRKFNLDLRNIEGRVAAADIEGNVNVWTASRSIHIGSVTGNVSAESAGGPIDVRGATGTARLKSAGGKLTLGEAAGPAVMETAGGSIKAGIVRGPLRAVTAGGSIIIGAAFNTVFAQTQGGSVSAAWHAQPQTNSIFSTAGGSIEIKLLPKLAFDLEALTQHGKVETDLPIEWQGDITARPRLGLLNGGGPKLSAKTLAGRIWFEELKDATLPVVAKFEFPIERPAAAIRAPRAPGATPKPEEGPFIPTGLLLRDGTSFAAEILGADDTQVSFRRLGAEPESMLSSRVTAVLLQPIPEKRRADLNRATTGLLLKNGDFMEGECRELQAGKVTMSSVLFGLRSYEAKRDARALIFHPLTGPPAK